MPTDGPVEQRDRQMSPGALLQQARLARNLSAEEVAERLHITVHYLKSLESDQYEKLPGKVYVTGYLKHYASLLGLEAADIVEGYKELVAEREIPPEEPAPPRVYRRRDYSGPYITVSVALFVAVFSGVWLFTGSGDDSIVANRESAATSVETRAPGIRPDAPPVLPPIADAAAVGGTGNAIPGGQEGPGAAARAGVPRRDGLSGQPPPADGTSSPASDTQQPTATGTGESIARVPIVGVDSATASDDSTEDKFREPAGTPADSATARSPAVAGAAGNSNLIEIHTEGSDTLRIDFSGASWVEVVDGSAQPIYSDLREAGDVLEITGHGPFDVLLGHAPRTRLQFNGDEVDVSYDVLINNTARLTVGL